MFMCVHTISKSIQVIPSGRRRTALLILLIPETLKLQFYLNPILTDRVRVGLMNTQTSSVWICWKCLFAPNQLGGGGPQGDHPLCVWVPGEDVWETHQAQHPRLQHQRCGRCVSAEPYQPVAPRGHWVSVWGGHWHECCCVASGGRDQSERDDCGLGQRDRRASLQCYRWVIFWPFRSSRY